MQMKDKDEWWHDLPFFAPSSRLHPISGEAIREAMTAFPLPMDQGRTHEWLAESVYTALSIIERPANELPTRPANVEVREEIRKMARISGKAWLALFERSDDASTQIWKYIWRHSREDVDMGGENTMFGAAVEARFRTALSELDWLTGLLDRVADTTVKQSPRWRESEQREMRIERAQYLFPVFEEVFGKAPLVHFTDFYQRITSLAYPEEDAERMGDIPDLEAVVSEAKKRHIASPVRFFVGVMAAS